MKTILQSSLFALLAAAMFVGCAQEQAARQAGRTDANELPPSVEQELVIGGASKSADYSGAVQRLGLASMSRPVDWNTEDYALIDENGFRAARANPLSTLSIDVDAASYSNMRRFIRQGQLPPRDAVRIEELINYFDYDYPEPESGRPFSVTTEVGQAPWNPDHQLVHIGLQGEKIDLVGRPASNLVFLLDVSGSMNAPDKLPLLKKAFRLLAGELSENDRVAIVVYAGAAGLVLPSTAGDQQETILEALGRLEAGGSTAGSAGIRLAYDTVREHFIEGGINRVILATDGDFNVGVSSDSELVQLVEDRREEGAFLTVLGFGTGNLKDNRMEQMADHGNGNYYYIDSELEARKVLVSELGGTLHTIAKDVKIQVEFNPARVLAYRLIGYENRLLASEDFNDDTKDAGELGAGHTVTALYEIVLVGSNSDVVIPDVDDLKYQQGGFSTDALSEEMMTVKLRYKAPDGDQSRLIERAVLTSDEVSAPSENFLFSAAVAEFGMIVRNSEHRGGADVAQVLKLAEDGMGRDDRGYRADFVTLVGEYQAIVLREESELNGG